MSDLLGQTKLTPVEFEGEVKASPERAGATLQSFVAQHRECIAGSDGEYEIDVTARFEPLGADFLVLVECKHQRRAVEREVVQVLADRVRVVGAQKGTLFTSASYQSGALLDRVALTQTVERIRERRQFAAESERDSRLLRRARGPG